MGTVCPFLLLSSIHRFYRFPGPFFFVVLKLRAQPLRCFKFFLAKPHLLLPKTFPVRLHLRYGFAASLSPSLPRLGFAVLEASPLVFFLTRSAALLHLGLFHSTFDPQVSYVFLGALLSFRSERVLLTVSRCLDSTRVIRDDFSGGVPFHRFTNQIFPIRHLLFIVFVLSRL